MYCCTSEGPLLSKCSSVLSGMFSPFSCTTRLAPGSSWPPCAAPAAEGHLKVQRVCQRTRVSDREGAMRGSGTEQEAVRGMGTGGGAEISGKHKTQCCAKNVELSASCHFSAMLMHVSVCASVYIYFFIIFHFHALLGHLKKKHPGRFVPNPSYPHSCPFSPPRLHSALNLIGEKPTKMGAKKEGKVLREI